MGYVDTNFLLTNDTARALYHEVAAKLPIVDYHCHLSPRELYENRAYESVGQMMLAGDHYKWRLMRLNGTPEEFVTGSASYHDKFLHYAAALDRAPGSPLAHWTALELQRLFRIDTPLSQKSAETIWRTTSALMEREPLRPRGLVSRFGVKLLCTTDDPADELTYHEKLAQENFACKVLPTYRSDRALYPARNGYSDYLHRLGETARMPITDLASLKEALFRRLIAFAEAGCRIADHSLEGFGFEPATDETAARVFADAFAGRQLSPVEATQFRSHMLLWLGAQYARLGWAQQYHIGAMRNNNTRLFRSLGADTGFDSMDDGHVAEPLSRLLNAMDAQGTLPRTVLYSLNPRDDRTLAALTGAFPEEGVRGKIQWGTPWWFNDQRDGIEAHLRTLGNMGTLGNFIGMLTDSRSFTSYTRHEYFRRILCNTLGHWVEAGELPADGSALMGLIHDICYRNAEAYFGFDA